MINSLIKKDARLKFFYSNVSNSFNHQQKNYIKKLINF